MFKDDQRWSERFEELKSFYKENGHSDVPTYYKSDPQCGTWYLNRDVVTRYIGN